MLRRADVHHTFVPGGAAERCALGTGHVVMGEASTYLACDLMYSISITSRGCGSLAGRRASVGARVRCSVVHRGCLLAAYALTRHPQGRRGVDSVHGRFCRLAGVGDVGGRCFPPAGLGPIHCRG